MTPLKDLDLQPPQEWDQPGTASNPTNRQNSFEELTLAG